MFEEMVVALIKDVGVPVGAFILMYALYVRTQHWQQQQQVNTELRFDKLVQCFIKNIREITDTHNTTILKYTEAIEKHTTMLEEHTRSKDMFMEYIKEGRMKRG